MPCRSITDAFHLVADLYAHAKVRIPGLFRLCCIGGQIEGEYALSAKNPCARLFVDNAFGLTGRLRLGKAAGRPGLPVEGDGDQVAFASAVKIGMMAIGHGYGDVQLSVCDCSGKRRLGHALRAAARNRSKQCGE